MSLMTHTPNFRAQNQALKGTLFSNTVVIDGSRVSFVTKTDVHLKLLPFWELFGQTLGRALGSISVWKWLPVPPCYSASFGHAMGVCACRVDLHRLKGHGLGAKTFGGQSCPLQLENTEAWNFLCFAETHQQNAALLGACWFFSS